MTSWLRSSIVARGPLRIATAPVTVTVHLWPGLSPQRCESDSGAASEPAIATRPRHDGRDRVAPGLASNGCASKPAEHGAGRSEGARPCRVHALVHVSQSPLRRHGGPDLRTDRGAPRIRPAVTSIRRCGMVDGPRWDERSPHRGMDRRASQRSPATECANRGV